MLLYLIGLALFGLVVGAIARFLLPGRDPMGCLGTILVGIAGSFVGGLLGSLLWYRDLRPHPAGFLGSLVGAILVLLILRAVRPRRGQPGRW
jgi:uncharacterized membrane protein YeaQ/YmgE (transglycosylase-associated protein family)